MIETTRTPVFSRFEVAERIGSGGMGTVFKARDMHLDRWVALKVLPPGMQENDEAMERFKREARALARLKHPCIAAVYDANVESGFPYVVMEFVEGDNLEQVLHDRGPIPIPEVIRLGMEIAEALDHIHRQGIIHRDVKTANIILGEEQKAVLADFGIAFEASLPRISQGALGTPEYMSPEQAAGQPLDGRADIYSLGIVLYECLTGRVPFRLEDESFVALSAFMKHVLQSTATPVSEICPDVPNWLTKVISKCLVKDPADRYASGAELVMALRFNEEGSPSLKVPDVPRLSHHVITPRGEPTTGLLESSDSFITENRKGIVLISHLQPVLSVTFSPDSKRLVSASEDGLIRVWQVSTGRLLHTLEGHEGNVVSAAFSPDGLYLASGDVVGSVRIWDAGTGRWLRTLEGHTALVMSVAFSPDSSQLVTGGADRAVRFWNVRKGRLLRTVGWHDGYVLSVSYSPDGTRLASGGADGYIHIWDVKKGRLLRTLDGHDGWVTSVSYNEDGSLLASGGADSSVNIWDTDTGRLVRTLHGHSDCVMSVSFSPNGHHLVSAGRDYTVRLWEKNSGRLIRKIKGHTGPVMSAEISPNGAFMASAGADRTVRIWPLHKRDFARRFSLKRLFGWLLLFALAAAGITEILNSAPERSNPAPTRETNLNIEQQEIRRSQERAIPNAVPDQATVPIPSSDRPLYSQRSIVPAEQGWTLVVAGEDEPTAAFAIVNRYRDLGFRSGLLPKDVDGRDYYWVGVGQFARRSEAVKARLHLAGNVLPYSTWVMRIRDDRES